MELVNALRSEQVSSGYGLMIDQASELADTREQASW